jgi:uncharacterized delta-60 repeat protein
MLYKSGRTLRAIFAGLCMSLLFEAGALAAPGDLDSSFSSNGKVTTNFTSEDDVVLAIAIQPDGKIVAAGGSAFGKKANFTLARYNTDGSLDSGFGGDGKVTTKLTAGHDWVNALTIQPNGKIVAVGGSKPLNNNNAKFALVRYDSDGTLDGTFDGDGKVTTNFTPGYDYAEDVALQPDGKIVVAGSAAGGGKKFALARYDPTGTLDGTFSGDGKVTTNFESGFDIATGMALQGDGKIVAAGWTGPAGGNNYKFALARYTTGGALDGTFSGDGKVTTNFTPGYDYAWDMALQPDGKIVAVGRAAGKGGKFALARYTTGGALDGTFSGDGKVTTNFESGFDDATGVAIQGDGKIVAAGWAGPAGGNNYKFALARYTTGGALDGTFSGDGKVTTNFTSGNDYAWDMALQPDGKIVAVGRAAGQGGKFALARYLAA